MTPTPPALAAAVLLATACGSAGPPPAASPTTTGGEETGTPEPASAPLDEQGWMSMFEEGQAAYYIEWTGTVWLVLRMTEDISDEEMVEVLGHVFSVVATRFDYSADVRSDLVLIGYRGLVEQRQNYGIKVDIDALRSLQDGELGMDDVLEEAGYIMNADIGALEPFITK